MQDRPQRLVEEAGRHHRAGEAIRCEGHQREGEGHDGGLSGGRQLRGKFFLCFGAFQAVSGNGLLFVCDCLAPNRASEYNCSLLRHGQMGSSRPRLSGSLSLGAFGGQCFRDLSGKEATNEPGMAAASITDGLDDRGRRIRRIPLYFSFRVMRAPGRW